jgi:acyl phosphate:glycerol-3-phosphate acyltransferase
MLAIAAVLAGYLAGSLPTGVIVARARGIDIRAAGSGNIGATNVARTLGKPLGALVLALDALKGFLPVFLMATRLPDGWLALVGLAAILGHVFPVWLRFRGGKGVATGLGVFAALAPLPALAAVAAYVLVVATSRISSLGSLTATSTLLVGMLLSRHSPPQIALALAVWLLIVIRHRENIRRLLRREERKV